MTTSYYVNVPAGDSTPSLSLPTTQIFGNSGSGYTSRLYFSPTEMATSNEFNFEFLQNFSCSVRYSAFYVTMVNEDGDQFVSGVHPLNVTVHGITMVRVAYGFPEFIGWEANAWMYLWIQNLQASGCSNVGLAPSGQTTLILNGFYSTLRQGGTLSG